MLQKNVLFDELFNYLTKLAAYWKGFITIVIKKFQIPWKTFNALESIQQ